MQILGYANVYRSGHFHREGKPNMYDRHLGDIYPTREAAIADISPLSHYVDTTPVYWEETVRPSVNAADSVPVPLSESRKKFLVAEPAKLADVAALPTLKPLADDIPGIRDAVFDDGAYSIAHPHGGAFGERITYHHLGEETGHA